MIKLPSLSRFGGIGVFACVCLSFPDISSVAFGGVEVSGSWGRAGAGDGELVYSNTLADLPFPAGAGNRVADDIQLNLLCPCFLNSYSIQVDGGGDGSGPGFTVEMGLYDDCPNDAADPGKLITGTGVTVAVPDDGLHTITYTYDGPPLVLSPQFWLAVEVDSGAAGWLTGQPPELGFSDDVYDFPTIPCVAELGGLFASFAAQVHCTGIPPEAADSPVPPDAAEMVDADPVLTWNNETIASALPEPGDETGLIRAEDFVSGTRHPDEFLAIFREAVASGEVDDPALRPVAELPEPLDFGSVAGLEPPPVTSGDIYLFEDTADILATGFSDGQLFNMMGLASTEVISTYGDNYDFVGFFINFVPEHQIGGAFYLGLQNDVLGIGLNVFNSLPSFGVPSERLQGWVMMWNQASWSTDLFSATQLVFGQEFEHRFAMYLAPMAGGRRLQGNDSFCGRSSHWNFKVDGQGSGMEIAEWVGDSPATWSGQTLTYNVDIPGSVFSYPDLYLMGYVTGEEMDTNTAELRYMDNNNNCELTYDGPISTWTSEDVKATNGPRTPSSFLAQKHFTTAWVMIHRPDSPPTQTQLGRTVQMLNHWNGTWVTSTLGRGTMFNVLTPPDPCDPSYDVYVGTDNPPSNLACANVSEPQCEPGLLQSDTVHYWQVVTERPGAQNSGPVWTFTTEPCSAPETPSAPVPSDDATDVALFTELSWSGESTTAAGEGVFCETSFDVYFGQDNPPTTLLCESTSAQVCDTPVLDPEAEYYWMVTGRTPAGESRSPVWSFTTEACSVPQSPFGPVPPDGSSDRPLDLKLSWNNMPVLISFNELPAGTLIDGAVIGDVTFSYEGEFGFIDGAGLNSEYINLPGLLSTAGGVVTLEFGVPVYVVSYGFGFDALDTVEAATQLTLYDSEDKVIDVVTASSQDFGFGLGEGFLLSESNVPITRAVITMPHPSAGFFVIDNLLYDPIPPVAVGLAAVLPGEGVLGAAATTTLAPNHVRTRFAEAIPGEAVAALAGGARVVTPDATGGTVPVAGSVGCPTTYDVYFGEENPPLTLICAGTSERTCFPDGIATDGTYFWQVVANTPGQITEGPIWSFSTPCTLHSSSPSNCAVDARQTHELGEPGVRAGWRFLTLEFNCDAANLTTDDFVIETISGNAPLLLFVTSDGPSVTLELLEPIPAGQWTCVRHVGSQSEVCFGYLPGDVDGSGTSDAQDVLAAIDAFNADIPLPLHVVDTDRSGEHGLPDILRAIDLLNGAGDLHRWLGSSIGDCPTQP